MGRMYDLIGFQYDLLTDTAGIEEPNSLATKDELEDYYESEIHHGRFSESDGDLSRIG